MGMLGRRDVVHNVKAKDNRICLKVPSVQRGPAEKGSRRQLALRRNANLQNPCEGCAFASCRELAQAKTGRHNPTRVQAGGALAFSVQDNAKLCRQHNMRFQASQAPSTTKRRTRGRASSTALPRRTISKSRLESFSEEQRKLQGAKRSQRPKQTKDGNTARRRRSSCVVTEKTAIDWNRIVVVQAMRVGFKRCFSETRLQRCA